jgi:hypothetical protein
VARLRRDGEPTPPWCEGWARYRVERRAEGHTLTLAAFCRFGDLSIVDVALVDTGAQ